MDSPHDKRFDNITLRVRGGRCVVSSAAPPFRTAFWPNVEAIGREFGLVKMTGASLEQVDVQEQFLTALADRLPETKVFRPGITGFRTRPEDVRQREDYRQRRALVTFSEPCPREVVLGALEVATHRLKAKASIEMQFKHWETLGDWTVVQERIGDALSYLVQTKRLDCRATVFADLQTANGDPWQFCYDRPRVRLGWLASDLAACNHWDQLDQFCRERPTFRTLQDLSEAGIWPHVILPASDPNTRLLPDLVLALIEVTRGGTVEILPAPLVLPGDAPGPPDVDDFVAAILAIYRNSRIPLHLVSPLSWVKARIDTDTALISSPMAAGAEIAVLANGDMYAGEGCVGLDQWRLGNVLDGADPLAWERLDAIPEVFSRSTAPDQCKTCDWRYRCGGIDPAVRLLEEQRHWNTRGGWSPLCELYCAPRKALFEEMLWDSVEAAAAGTEKRPRERIELHPDGFTFEPVAAIKEA